MHSSPKVFQFRQFQVHQSSSVMPVGTDSVLLGSWVDISNASYVLDAGCGTGLLAIMAAQRHPDTNILGLDNNLKAAKLAFHNVNQTEWKDRICIQKMDVFSLKAIETPLFSHIVCNPPYFISGTKSPSRSRSSFRHTKSDFFESFFSVMRDLSESEAFLGMVLPFFMRDPVCVLALSHGWYIRRELRVKHSEKSEFSLCLLEWGKLYDREPDSVSQYDSLR